MAKTSIAGWLRGNCKFAAIMDILSPAEVKQLVDNPSSIVQVMLGAYKRRQGMGGAFSQLSAADVAADLEAADRMLAAQAPAGAPRQKYNTPDNVQAIVDTVNSQQPQQAKPQSRFQPDPFDSYRKTRGL